MSLESLESIQKEWREIVLMKLGKLESDMGHLSSQVTDIRVAQVTQKEMNRLEQLLDDKELRIKALEEARTRIYTIFFTLQVAIGVVWSVILGCKK